MLRTTIAGFVISVLCLSVLGCSSKLIEHPGLRAQFVWEDTGLPISHTEVVLTHIAHNHTVNAKTDESGNVVFAPTFTSGYSGYPTSPVSLQLSWMLKVREKHNPSGAYLFVKNTDVGNATIDAGTIKVSSIFRAEQGGEPDAASRLQLP